VLMLTVADARLRGLSCYAMSRPDAFAVASSGHEFGTALSRKLRMLMLHGVKQTSATAAFRDSDTDPVEAAVRRCG